jgi:hypothetical protein
VACRSIARPAAPQATTAPATSTTAPEPGADARELGWSDRVGRVTITAVSANRFIIDRRETVAAVTFRVNGLPPGQRLLALRGLRMLDSGGGTFSSVEQRQLGNGTWTPVVPDEDDPDTYTVTTGPAPQLGALARIELTALVVDRPRDNTVELDTAGSWPAGPPLRAINPGPRDTIKADVGFVLTTEEPNLNLLVTAAFVGDGWAVVMIDSTSAYGFRGFPSGALPLSAELRAGGRVLCTRTTLIGDDVDQGVSGPGIVLACPAARPAPRLTLAVGAGVRTVELDATLRP